MTLGLYKVGENQPITRVRRGLTTASGRRLHLVPDYDSSVRAAHEALCGAYLHQRQTWRWSDEGEDCKSCQTQARQGLRAGTLALVDPVVVAEFMRTRLAHLGDRQTAAAEQAQPEARLAVEIYRPRDDVMGSVGTRREIHLPTCILVGQYERPMVPLPVSEVRRQYNADGSRTTFCQLCKPFHVLDNERKRPHTLAEARALSTREGYLARDRYCRTARNPHRSYAFRTLPHDGSRHFEDCPAEPDELLRGDVTEPNYGRCKCYTRYATARPGERPDDDDSPEWTLG
jgi:hypothetical protein